MPPMTTSKPMVKAATSCHAAATGSTASTHRALPRLAARRTKTASDTSDTAHAETKRRDVSLFHEQELETVLKPTVEYRIKRIEVKRSDKIDHIKITYDDGSEWSVGHDSGKADTHPVVFADGEYLVRVTHEKFINNHAAGAGVLFESNLGRVWTYHPSAMATKMESERRTATADDGHEIICLTIRHGLLCGITQQAATPAAGASAVLPPLSRSRVTSTDAHMYKRGHAWLAVVAHRNKEEWDAAAAQGWQELRATSPDAALGNTGTVGKLGATVATATGSVWVKHFHRSQHANEAWATMVADVHAKPETRGAILIDCMKWAHLKSTGAAACHNTCTSRAREGGLLGPAHRDDDFSMLATIGTLLRVVQDKNDLRNLVVVTLLLMASFYLEVEAAMLTGQVMTAVTGSVDELHASISDSWAARLTCKAFSGCVAGLQAVGAAADTTTGATDIADTTTGTNTLGMRYSLVAAFVLVRCMAAGLYVANVYVHHTACDHKNYQLRTRSFGHVLALDQTYFDTHTMSEIRGGMNVHALNDLISWNLPYLTSLALKMVMVVWFMLRINVATTVIALGTAMLVKFAVIGPLKKHKRRVIQVRRKLDMLQRQIIDEAFGLMQSVKLFSKEAEHLATYSAASSRAAANTRRLVTLRCLTEFGDNVMRVAAFGGALAYGMRAVSATGLSPADLTSAFLLMREFLGLMGRVRWHWERLRDEMPDIERFLTLMRAKSGLPNGHKRPTRLVGDIEFQDVGFEYPSRPGQPVVNHLNLRIQPYKMTAIVGDSGAGKSTITKLLMRLYDPQQGRVFVDGHDLRELDLQHFHGQMSIVNQNPALFDASIADNIAYGAVDGVEPDMVAIEAAARLANCYDFVKKFRGGFDTCAGSMGAKLSGGQKQRIAIARAAIRDPKILILDEATSSLDAENEELVQQALQRLMQGRTTVVIAHRLSTVRDADEILCMKDGRVVERGTHLGLLQQGGVYADLVRRQMLGAPTATVTTLGQLGVGGGNNVGDDAVTDASTDVSDASE